MTIRVIIADDERLIRNLYVNGLKTYEDIKIVGQAGNGEEVMEMLKNEPADVLLLDLGMPRITGMDVLKFINKKLIKINTLIISMQDDDALIQAAIHEGALGYLIKNDHWDEMYQAIKTVAEGQFHNTNRINSVLLQMARGGKLNHLADGRNNIEFNDRELAIIQYLNDGLSSADIGEKLFCSRSNIDRIRQELIHKVGAKNTAGLIAYKMRQK